MIEEVKTLRKNSCKTKDLVPAAATTLRRYFVVALNPFGVLFSFKIILEELVIFDQELIPVIFCKVIVEFFYLFPFMIISISKFYYIDY